MRCPGLTVLTSVGLPLFRDLLVRSTAANKRMVSSRSHPEIIQDLFSWCPIWREFYLIFFLKKQARRLLGIGLALMAVPCLLLLASLQNPAIELVGILLVSAVILLGLPGLPLVALAGGVLVARAID